MSEIHRLGIKSFRGHMNSLCRKGYDFELHCYGGSFRLVYEGKTYTFVDRKSISGRGFHLCNLVRRDVSKYLLGKKDFVSKYDISGLKVNRVNAVNLRSRIGDVIYRVDVRECYWDTLYKLGFVSQLTYLRGLQKDEWKDGRNSSIGGLGKSWTVATYRNGKRVNEHHVCENEGFKAVRSSVVGSVHEMFTGLIEKLGVDFLMYFTDCVYVPLERIADCEQYFEERGYQSKVDVYQLDSVSENMIVWHDFKNNRAKSFRYSNE